MESEECRANYFKKYFFQGVERYDLSLQLCVSEGEENDDGTESCQAKMPELSPNLAKDINL
jgi:hypothetical protein